MITNEKRFGSYVLEKATTLFLDERLGFESTSSAERERDNGACAIPNAWTSLALVEINPVNYNTSIFRFRLLSGDDHLCLPLGSFLLIKAPQCEHDGSDAIRPYTNIEDESLAESAGYFDILCKRYDEWGVKENIKSNFLFTRTDHSYRPKGAVSSYLHGLRLGDEVLFRCMSC
jgi:hypothetical protein